MSRSTTNNEKVESLSSTDTFADGTHLDIPTHDAYDKVGIDYSDVDEMPTETRINVDGITHARPTTVQLNDDNELYQSRYEYTQELIKEEDHIPRAEADPDRGHNHPYPLATWNPSWAKDDREVTLGFFSSKSWYGMETESGNWSRYYTYHLQLYDNIEKGTDGITNLSSSTSVTIEMRDHDMVTENLNKCNWKKSESGQMVEGTAINIQASYVEDGEEAIERVREMFEVGFGEEFAEKHLNENNINYDTLHCEQPEVYKRFDSDLLDSGVSTLRDSTDLITSGDESGSGSERGEWEKDHYTIYGFTSDYFAGLGLHSPTDEDGEPLVEEVYLKIYMHQQARQLPDDHMLSNPKIEAKAYGKYYESDWNAVRQYLNQIVNMHCHHAGIKDEDLIADNWFNPEERDATEWKLPTGRRAQVRQYWASDRVRRNIEQRLFEADTDNYLATILGVLRKGGNVTRSTLAEYTGLSKRGVSRIVRKLKDDNILTREDHGQTFVKFAPGPAKKKVREILDRAGMTERELEEKRKDIREENIQRRERRNSKENESSPGDNEDEEVDTGGRPANPLKPLAKLPIDMQDLYDDYRAGCVTDEDIHVDTRVHESYAPW
ncbi:MarR family transcriptional regulator [Natronobacterium gregoryi]|uniref:Crp/Fnr family transcriptional regulator n=2 Tax=Natronobacterium gregoryi TaxID=44930 RepID=L0AIP3_NATGS|nr:MarR family transcriptional regulator [Natronobacterium gregoryi]AFZ73758.1 hypothetical protein Natgr_2607 [Natronobacterium gregoryi SP2]ELY65817.1 hypothetical protein C490_13596 [Natronobacterium gregoryi SP2]PLK19447.1 Crp/Fnr family transcriptional regulator [Natronobacterium gregoryi SP2]SFJ48655.1 hypothetical protein SAMN05443661_13337 [Natronobacterium gregoryi]